MSSTGEETGAAVATGTGRGLIEFLNWTMQKNELVKETAMALRTGCQKVLSAEDDSAGVDLRTADLDSIVSRFKIKHRGDMKDRTREQYEQRFRQSVDMYLKWLDDDPTWKPTRAKRTATGNGNSSTKKLAQSPNAQQEQHPDANARQDPPTTGMIKYPFPIRPGLQATIVVPENMTMKEARRVAAFVSTLAFEDEPQQVPALQVRQEEPAEGEIWDAEE